MSLQREIATAPSRHTRRRFGAVRVVLFAGLLSVLGASGSTAATARTAVVPTLKVVARDLNNPRKISIGADGALYVAEAGKGGHDRCLGSCVGLTGSITRVLNGHQSRVVTGLMSVANPTGQAAEGPAGAVFQDGTYTIVMQDTGIHPSGVDPLGPDMATAGDLLSTPGGATRPKVIASLVAYEIAHNPDHGAGPGSLIGQPSLDSDPYALTPYEGGFAVVDAAGNDLFYVSPQGRVSLLAVFPTQVEKLSAAEAKSINHPTLRSIVVQSVPTSVTVGPDGALYVGELTGWPLRPGTARVWRIEHGKRPTVFASGFTNISDLAFDGDNLLVLEMAADGILVPGSPGVLLKVTPSGARTVIASAGLSSPTGLAVGNGSIYISNFGVSLGSGKGPHGEVVSIPAALGL